MPAGVTDKSKPPVSIFHQVGGEVITALKVITANTDAGMICIFSPPAHKMGALIFQLGQFVPPGGVVSVTEQNDTVSFFRVFKLSVPVIVQILKRHQQIVTGGRTRPCYASQHVKEKRVYH